MREFHVAVSGNDMAAGTEQQPFATISKAARTAMPGDTVIVHGGVYREWVDPEEGGLGELERITYRAAAGEKPVIKGSEKITGWERVGGTDSTVFKAAVPNALFGDFNPYTTYIDGDWMVDPPKPVKHLGDVYLNGKSFYEAESIEGVKQPVKRTEGFNVPWTLCKEPVGDPEGTLYTWYSEQDTARDETVIYANFQGADPNAEMVEINVRKCCFYPTQSGKNYITVDGFEIAQAACPFAPPTADQPGMIGAHWSRGWIIENCDLHDAKCSAVSLGKDEKTGDNMFTKTRRKPGYTYQFEAVCRALQLGWSKETIGSHIVRGNVIHDCGQNGVVGHMGCVFSEIYGNEIYNIATKHEFYGYEIAGIKLHAAIDVRIHNNNIHDCTLGIWLDWEAQDTRVSSNLFYENDRDLMVEVTHGPYIVDNNIFASNYNFDNVASGGAYLQNLCCGTMRRQDVLDRSTPYHFPHTTQMMGSSFVYSGDDRLYQNIFLGGEHAYRSAVSLPGTVGYNGCPASYEEYIDLIKAALPGDENLYVKVKQPAWIDRNVYLKGAKPYDREESRYVSEADPDVKVVKESDGTYLEITIERGVLDQKAQIMRTEDLGMTRAAEAPFDNPDGSPIAFDTDYSGTRRDAKTGCHAGPLEGLHEGRNRIRVW